ncbi:IclR family transcriptional regulator [Roseibium sediminis]|uniref:IclR family transcriptional regulator n=1 Tax=Roseibium sediminis TaxID=1775174 RepID=UPI00123D666E|nr:IclR family transcriptional regulator [Roseibium sediminis]
MAEVKNQASPRDDPRFLTSVERGFLVLDTLSDSLGPMSLTEIAKATGLAVPTLQRLTGNLIQAGYLEKHSGSKRYSSTVKTVDLLFSYLSRNQFAKRAWPHLVKLREDLGLDVSLSVPSGGTMVYVHRLPGYSGNFENTLPGKKVPIHLSASGRCILSLMANERVRHYLASASLAPLTPWSITDPALLLEEIAQCRKNGFSVVRQEATSGTLTLACPIRRASEAVAGVSVHVPIAGTDENEFVCRALPLVVSVSDALRIQ